MIENSNSFYRFTTKSMGLLPLMKDLAGESQIQQKNETVSLKPFTMTPLVIISLSSFTNGSKYSFKSDGLFVPHHIATIMG